MPDNDEKARELSNIGDDIKDPQTSGRMKEILESVEFLSLSKGSSGNVDLSTFSEEQRNRILDLVAKNEDNAYNYHMKRLQVIENITIKNLDSGDVNKKTLRFLVIGGLIIYAIITAVILILKDQFLTTWIITGSALLGGSSLPSIYRRLFSESKVKGLPEDNQDI